MSTKNCTVKFYLKNPPKNNPLQAPIYCRITYNRKKAEFFTGEKIDPTKWLAEAGMPKKSRRLEEYLINIKSRLLERKRTLEYTRRPVSAKALKEYYRIGDKIDETYFLEYFDEIYSKEILKPDQYSEGTIRRYRVTKNHYLNFLKNTKREDILLENFDISIIRDFDYFLLTVPTQQYKKPMGRNSANNYHKKIKKVLGMAVKDKLITINPYIDFPLKDEKTDRSFLTKDELTALKEHDLGGNDSLAKTRDIFLFSCYTGLRYLDAQNLRSHNIYKNSDGDYWLVFNQKKLNDKKEMFPLLQPAVELYHKHDHFREVTGYILPRMSNPKINTYLKIIAELVGIRKHLTHHVARHTFATTVTLGNDMPLEMVSAFLGHSDLKTTQIYAKLTPNYKLKYAKAVNEKLK